jgi:hypothetical protein
MRHLDPVKAATLMKEIESAKWRLWNGQAEGCFERLHEALPETSDKLHVRLTELINYLLPNQTRLIDYGVRYRNGLPVSSSLAVKVVTAWACNAWKRFRKTFEWRWRGTPRFRRTEESGLICPRTPVNLRLDDVCAKRSHLR